MQANCLFLSVRIFISLSRALGLRSHVIGTVAEAEGPANGPTEDTSSAPSLRFSSAPLVWAYLLRSWRNANFALCLCSFLVSFPRELRGDEAYVNWALPPQKKQPGHRPKKRAHQRVLKAVGSCCLLAGPGVLGFLSQVFCFFSGLVVHISRRRFASGFQGKPTENSPKHKKLGLPPTDIFFFLTESRSVSDSSNAQVGIWTAFR